MADLISLFDSLVRVEIRLWNDVEARLQSELGISLTFAEFLSFTGKRGQCRVSDLADDLGVTHSGASRIVDRMEAEGLVARTSNPDDRRSSLISLTNRGIEVRAQAEDLMRGALQELLGSHLGEEQLDALAEILGGIRR
jgi:DNA-binding MarR family transcriptional regulator